MLANISPPSISVINKQLVNGHFRSFAVWNEQIRPREIVFFLISYNISALVFAELNQRTPDLR